MKKPEVDGEVLVADLDRMELCHRWRLRLAEDDEVMNPRHPVGKVDTSENWRERRRLLLNTARVYQRLDELIAGAKANQVSLAVFKPARVVDFVMEPDEREWDPDKVRQMREASKQYDLFADNTWRETFNVIPKLPYKFSYKFEDAAGQVSRMRVLDSEAGTLYWNCLRSADGDEPRALAKVRQKYFDDFLDKDLHFFLGTTQQWHQVAPNPWVTRAGPDSVR